MEVAAVFITRHIARCLSGAEVTVRGSHLHIAEALDSTAHSCPQFIHTLCSNTEC